MPTISFDDLIPQPNARPQQSPPSAPQSATPAPDPWEAYVDRPAAPADADPWAGHVDVQPSGQPERTAARVGAISFDDLIPAGRDLAAPSGDPLGDAENMAAPGTRQAPWAEIGQRADDLVRTTADGATFGMADRLAGWLNGSGTQGERALTQQAADRLGPGLTAAAKTVGTLAPAGAAARGVGALGELYGVASPILRGAATGAAVSAGNAAGHDESILPAAATGAALGGAVPAALGGASRLAGLFADAPAVPTSDELRAAASSAYRAADDAGVIYSPQATQRLDAAVRSHMADFGYDPALQPGGAAVLNSLDRIAAGGGNATLRGIDVLRQNAGQMASPTYPSAGALGRGIKGVVDDFTANPQPGDIVGGDGDAGVSALQQARQLYQRSSKDQGLLDALGRGELQAGSSGSGGNINNATRQQVRQLYQGRQDWTPDEDAALRAVIMGSPVSNALRQIGKLSPEGNGLMQGLSVLGGHEALTTGSPGMLAAPAAGFVAKRAADAMTARAVDRAGQLIRAGGDATALQGPPTAVQQYLGVAGDPLLQTVLADYAGSRNRTAAPTLGGFYGAP